MADLNVIWEDGALDLLDGRDRYTRNAIREEFRLDPQKGVIELDVDSFLTPVSDKKFSVVWRKNNEGAAVVRAVVPLGNVSLDAAAFKDKPEAVAKLKEYVRRVVKSESNERIDL